MRGLLAVALMAGCVDAGPVEYDIDGDGKADGNGTCEDAKYGDGTCHIDLACGIPDIDCFKTYASDEEATAASTAALSAYGMTTLPITDARYATTRARVDKAWDLYKQSVPLGKLGEQHLSLVLMNDPEVNAFVMPTETAGVGMFTVHVNMGLIDAPGMTEDQFDGIFFHELTHLAKLHLSDEVAERLRRYYVTPTDTTEPLGSTQIQHEQLRSRMQQWRALTPLTGWFVDPALGDWPVGGTLFDLLGMYLVKAETTTPACKPQVDALSKISEELKLGYHDQQIVIPAGWSTRLDTALTAFKTCTAADLVTFKQFRDGLDAESKAYLDSVLTPEDMYLDETRALDAILALSYDRRLKMRLIEIDIAAVSGRPFSALRFFSQEEQADDVSARLTKIHQLDEVGSSGFLMAALGEEKAKCEALLEAGGNLPYGRLLDDDHHADCWRIAHMRRVHNNTERALEIKDRAPAPWTPTKVRKGPLY